MSDRARKPPTLEQRVARVMTSVVQGDRDAYIRTLIWRELSAAVRLERKACASECRVIETAAKRLASVRRKEGDRVEAEMHARREYGAKHCADRIKRRPKP